MEEIEATEEHNEILERIVLNSMRVVSGEHADKVETILSSGQSAGEGLSNAITFVLQAVIGGLQKKDIEVTPEIVMSENGAASQVTQLLVMMIGASGRDITPNEIQQAMSVGIQNLAVKQRRQGRPDEGQPPEGGPPQGQPPMQEGAPQGGPPPQQPPQGQPPQSAAPPQQPPGPPGGDGGMLPPQPGAR